jgi:AAA domain
MPRKGAATAAKPDPEPETPPVSEQTEDVGSEATADEVAYNESVAEPAEPAKPKRRTPAERAAERKAAREDAQAAEEHADESRGFEDWTRPSYADDPGEFEFASLDDETEHLSILWWGKEGTGKTTNLARVAAAKLLGEVEGQTLMINAEGGAKVTPLRHHGIDTSRIMVYPKKGQPLTFEGLERLYYKLAADLEADPHSWAAVGWDSITAIVEKLLDDVIEADMRKQAEILQRAKKGREGRSGNITLRDRFETEGDDYAAMSNQVRLLLRKYRTLPLHFLVTALERRDEDKKRKGSKPQYGPAVNPAIQTALLGYVDIVIRTHVLDDATYYGRTTPTEDSRGKDRMASLPIELVDPTFDRILGYVRGRLDHDTDPAQKRMPGGAEGLLVRRSLADDPWNGAVADAPHHTKDGTATGEPLAGDKDDPDPPKRGRRRPSGASSGRTTASARESAQEETASSEAENPAPEPESAVVESEPPARRSGRKTAAQREADRAKRAVNDEPDKPATRAAKQRTEVAKRRQEQTYGDDPPF